MVQNKALVFSDFPQGWPQIGKDLTLQTSEFDLEQAPPANGITAKVHYVSFDPYQRGRMRRPEIKSYAPAFTLGQPITNAAIVSVIKSANSKFRPGDVLTASGARTEEYSVLDEAATKACAKLDNPYGLDPKTFTGALGMPGLTAYSSFYAIGAPKRGETIFISAASGAVGQLVGQLAKLEGLTVVGSVGDDEKLDFITRELGFDGGFNYKKEEPLEALRRLAPDGIDIYYENVGGVQLEAAIEHMRDHGRIVACGMISQYNATEAYGVRNLMQVVAKRLTMRGFIVGDANMGPLYADEHQRNVQKWIHEGKFKAQMSVTHGMERAAEGLLGMFRGENFGKAVLEVAPLESAETKK